jgi:hypothetical protein
MPTTEWTIEATGGATNGLDNAYPTRDAFLEADLLPTVTRAAFVVGRQSFAVIRHESGTIAQDNGQLWAPDGPSTPQHFGWEPGADCGPPTALALTYEGSLPLGRVYFPTGQYIFETQASVVYSGAIEREVVISGDGRSSMLYGANADGVIKIRTANGNRRAAQLRDISIVPIVQNAGCAFAFTAPEGGVNNRGAFRGQNIWLARPTTTLALTDYEPVIAKHCWGQATGGSVLDLSGLNRPNIEYVMMHPQPGSTEYMGLPYALLNLDGCYNPVVKNCVLNGRAQRGITFVRERDNEGGRIIGCNIVGPEIGIYVDQTDGVEIFRHPRFHVSNTHVNAIVKAFYIANTKFINFEDVWTYGKSLEDDEGEGGTEIPVPVLPDQYIDIHLHNCNAVDMSAILFRASNVQARRHLYFTGGTRDVVVRAEKGFVAEVTVPPVFIDGTCRDITMYLPSNPAHYDFREYPDNLFEIDPAATGIRVYDELGTLVFNATSTTVDRRAQADLPTAATTIARREGAIYLPDGTSKEFTRDELVAINGTDGRRIISVLVGDAISAALQLDRAPGNNQTAMTILVRDPDGVYRTYRGKVGANDTGPGGAGRAFFIDNAP